MNLTAQKSIILWCCRTAHATTPLYLPLKASDISETEILSTRTFGFVLYMEGINVANVVIK